MYLNYTHPPSSALPFSIYLPSGFKSGFCFLKKPIESNLVLSLCTEAIGLSTGKWGTCH